MAKQIKKSQPKVEIPPLKSYFDNDYILLGILFIFWLIFFRQLLSGNAYLFDDFIEQYYPSKFMAYVMLSKGVFPFWNPFIFSGMPFFADLQIAVLYPFNFVLTLFVHNEKLSALAIQNSIIFHYLLTSVFTFYLAKHFKLSGIFSLIFALLFTYSSYMIIHMMHQPLIEAATWFPLFFLLWLKFIDTKKYYYPLLGGLIMALCILAGYPQVPFFNLFFVAIYSLFISFELFKQKKNRDIISVFLGLIIVLFFTFGLTAFQLIPSLEFIGLSNRASFDYNFAKQGSMHIYDYITLVIPKFFGVWSGNEKIGDIQYWSKHSEGPWMFSVSNVFISTLIIVLIIPSYRYFFKEKKNLIYAYFSVFIIVFAFMFSLGGNFFFHKLMFDFVPFFNRFRNPAHVVYIMMMAVIMITMIGTNGIIKDGKVKEYFNNKYILLLTGIVFVFFLIVYSGMLLPVYVAQIPQVISYVKSQGLIFLIFVLLFSLSIYLFANNKINLNTFGLLLITILLFEIYFIWFEQNNGTRNPEQVYSQRSQLIEKFKSEMKDEVFRVNSRDGSYMLFQRNQGFVDGIEFLEGYGALLLKNFIPPNGTDPKSSQSLDLMNVKYKIITDSTGKGKYLGANPNYLPRASMFYDAVRFNNDEQVKNFMMSNGFNYHRTLVIEDNEEINLPKLNPADSIPVNSVKILEHTINSLKVEVETAQDGLLYFSEVFYPAFKGYLDGNPVKILKTDFCMRSVLVPKGKHIVEMKYESESFRNGLIISIISLCLFAVMLPAAVYISKKNMTKKKDENSD